MLHCDLSIITRGGEIFISRCLADFGITATEVMILSFLYGHENPRQEDIAEFFMLDKGSVAKTLQKLEKKEMLERRVNEEDQREKVISLTEKGHCVRSVCTNLVKLWHDTMFDGITAEEAAAFERVVHRIARNVTSSLDQWETIYGNEKA